MGKRSHALILVVLILVGVLGFLIYLNQYLAGQKADLTRAVETLKSEYSFARIHILSKGAGRITYRLDLKSPSGASVASVSGSTPGNDLYIESRVAVISTLEGEKAFVFPARVYSDTIAPAQGKVLYEFYVKDQFPAQYEELAKDQATRRAIQELFAMALKEQVADTAQDALGVKILLQMDAALHQSGSGYREGGIYDCVVHPNGGMELMEAAR